MPDKDGWEIQSRRRETIWHAPCDSHVQNTPAARRAHLTECRRRERAAARATEKRRLREAADRLRLINRERALERKVLDES